MIPKIIPALLLLAAVPASAQFLSDKTGLVSELDVEAGGATFEVVIVGNFAVDGHELDGAQGRLLVLVDSSLVNNTGEMILPRELLGGNLTLRVNGEPIEYDVRTNDRISFVTMDFAGSGDNELEVYGTTHLGSPVQAEAEAGTDPGYVAWAAAGAVAVAAALAVRRWTTQRSR